MSFAISMALRHWKPLLIGALFSCGVLFFFFFAAAPPEDQYIGNVQQGVITPLGEQEIPAEYVPIYQAAGKKYNVPWQLIAAIHRVETHFGADLNVSSVGALGHTQFMVLTWININSPFIQRWILKNLSNSWEALTYKKARVIMSEATNIVERATTIM